MELGLQIDGSMRKGSAQKPNKGIEMKVGLQIYMAVRGWAITWKVQKELE